MLATPVKSKPQIVKEDLFAPKHAGAVLVIPVNPYIKNDGKAVMAKGVAGTAARKFKGIDANWGNALLVRGRLKGNAGLIRTEAVGVEPAIIWDHPMIVAFPTQWHFDNAHMAGKHFSKKADLGLIRRSCYGLVAMADFYKWYSIYLPRVGCGQGERDFEEEVRPILEDCLDARFKICIP